MNIIKTIVSFFDFRQCHKERLGYNCHHRIYSNGFKECGGNQ